VTDGRVCDGVVGVHEGTEKVLAAADHPGPAHARDVDRPDAGVSGRALRIYVVLMTSKSERARPKAGAVQTLEPFEVRSLREWPWLERYKTRSRTVGDTPKFP